MVLKEVSFVDKRILTSSTSGVLCKVRALLIQYSHIHILTEVRSLIADWCRPSLFKLIRDG